MPLAEIWIKVWVYLGLVCGWAEGARPRFDTSTDMGLVLVPADAEVDSVIFRLRATDQDADFPLVFEVTATITPVVRIDNLPCTLYNKVCQANVILTKRLMPGRLHDFAVRVRDTKGDSNSMQATISATNATTSRDKIFPHIPSLIMVPEDTRPGKELDYILVRANSWSGKPVYIELWQPKELFTIRQRQTPTQTRGAITLIGELDFETQSMYTLTIYATDPYTEPGKDTRNIAGLNVVVVVRDVQDVPPIFTSAPPLTRLNNSVQTGDVILRVHAEDGDKGVPRDITYGLVSEGNPFVPFFNISETTGEIVLARPLEELTQITHVGAPVVLSVVAEEIRRSREEPPAQATVVEVGFLLGEPGNSPPYFENDKYIASIQENLEPGSVIMFPEQYSTKVRDEDIGKAGVFALKLQNNNGTFEVNPAVAERTADFVITVRDNTLIDYETHKSLSFRIVAQEVGPATNLSAFAAVVIFIQDVNDNSPVFDEESYEVTLSENVTAGTRVAQVHATDEDTGLFGSIKYTGATGQGSEAFAIDPDTGLITVAMGSSLDREMAAQLQLTVYARDENGRGNAGAVPLLVNLLDVNDNAPVFEKDVYEFTLNSDLTNFTVPSVIKATDADAEPPNNEIRYELIHGNYENKFQLNEITGELVLRSPITKFRRKKQSVYDDFTKRSRKGLALQPEHAVRETATSATVSPDAANTTESASNKAVLKRQVGEIKRHRRKRAESDVLYSLTARAYDLGVPHLSSETQILVVRGSAMEARIMMFVVPGEHPNLAKTIETLATITGGRVTVLDTRPYVPNDRSGVTGVPAAGKRTIVVARVEQTEPGAPLVDVEKIRNTLAANGVGIIGGTGTNVSMTYNDEDAMRPPIDGGTVHDGGGSVSTYVNKTISSAHEEVTVYKAENKLLFWLLIILGLLMLLAIAALIVCCTCPGCPFYMAPRKRRVYSSETLIPRSDGRPKRHIHRKPMAAIDITSNGKKQAWSADPARRNWQFNRRNAKDAGLASLPGDVVYITERPTVDQGDSLRLRDGPVYDPSRRRRMEEQERMYVEDVEERKIRDYDAADVDSLQRHEAERGSDILHQIYRQRYVDPEANEPAVREQHFYREGNAEVLQLVTRGQADDSGSIHRHHYPTTLIVDGKDVLLQRFIQDQKPRHELIIKDTAHTVEPHQRQKSLYQQEVLLLPEDLEIRHVEEMGSQKLAMDEDAYEAQRADAESHLHDARRQAVSINASGVPSTERPMMVPKDQTQPTTVQSYALHDLELARQNVLLTRLLLERDSRFQRDVTGAMLDAASYLETQSLPGQVAIATQTDRAATTQTERQARSRSDNDESDEDGRSRKRMKTKKRYGERESKRIRSLWMKSPIEEEVSPRLDKRLNILRRKVKETWEGRKEPLEPGVLREISDSLGENGGSCRESNGEWTRTRQEYTEDSSIGYRVLGEKNGSSSPSTELSKRQYERVPGRRAETLSSPEMSVDNGKYVRETTERTCSRKESKTKKHKKVESIIKPSFRVLEREITMLTKKLSKLADRKVQRRTGDGGTSQERSRASKDSKKDSERATSKSTEDSRQRKRSDVSPSTSKETVAKTRQKLKHQQFLSPGSSEYDDALERRLKKSKSREEVPPKHKQTGSHARIKRQTQVERKEVRRQVAQHDDREIEKRRDAVSKETGRTESKAEKAAKLSSRAQKLAVIGRREKVSEDPSTSTSSDRADGKKDPFVREPEKKSAESSAGPSSQVDRRKSRQKLEHASERFSDDFVTEQRRKDQPGVIRSIVTASTRERDAAGEVRDIEIIQQFSDDFVMEAEESAEYRMPVDKMDKIVSRALDKERVTLKETAEGIVTLQKTLEHIIQPKTESILDAAEDQLDDSRRVVTAPLESVALEALEEQIEKPTTTRGSESAVEEEIAREKREEEVDELLHKIEKEILRREEATSEKDSEDKDFTGSLQPYGGGEVVELFNEAERDVKEKLTHIETKEHIEQEISLAESAVDVARKVRELAQRDDESDSLRKVESDAEKEMKITATDVSGHRDVTEEPKGTSREYVSEFDSEKIKRDLKSAAEATGGTSDIDKSPESDPANLINVHRASLADEDDRASTSVAETNRKLMGDTSTQSESDKVSNVRREDADMEKVERSDDDFGAAVEMKSDETRESRASPCEPSDLREISKPEKEKSFIILTDITTAHKEFADEGSLWEGRETFFVAEERSDETTEGTRDEGSTSDQSSRDSKEPAASERDAAARFETVAESTDTADSRDGGEQRADVSVPLFTSFADTLGVSEESDSSSDVSRKTMLSARPYDTPRHRQKWQQQGSFEIAGMPETRAFDDGRDATAEIEAGEDTDSNLSLDEIENAEGSVSIDAAVDEQKDDTETTATTSEEIPADDEKAWVAIDSRTVSDEGRQDGDSDLKFDKIVGLETDTKTDVADLSMIIQTVIPLTLSISELEDASRENIKDASTMVTKEESKSATRRKRAEEISETAKQNDESGIESSLKQTEHASPVKDKTEDAGADKARSKDVAPSISEKHIAQIESTESSVKKRKKLQQLRASPRLEARKCVVEESPEKLAPSIQSRRRAQRQTKNGESQWQSRREEGHQRRQPLPRSKLKQDKRSTACSKGGEIDTSKTRSKYMAWYNKRHEEAEKKRLEKKTAEDEEQLPRWVSRSLKYHTTRQKDRQQGAVGRRTPEITPRTRRKVKPLVNVESEQLKAIVRQGRQLRRAEGILREDPPIQIFARTPPVTAAETRHHLTQHSEYKYERVPPPFYLHPPPAPHPSPQLSPERTFETTQQPSTSQCVQTEDEPPLHAEGVAPFQAGARLRHQQLLEKKSVFDIAYSEAAPSQLRSDSTTPPS